MRIFIDTNIPMNAAGKPSIYKDRCKEILAKIAGGELDAVTDTEVFQEILYRYFHIRQMELGRQIFTDFKLVVDSILSVLPKDIFLVEALARQYPETKPRDLLHAAVMRNNGIDKILSVDRDFDEIDRIERIDPLEFV